MHGGNDEPRHVKRGVAPLAHGDEILFDPSMAIGRAYGMLDESAQDSAAVRASYFIDPVGTIEPSLRLQQERFMIKNVGGIDRAARIKMRRLLKESA